MATNVNPFALSPESERLRKILELSEVLIPKEGLEILSSPERKTRLIACRRRKLIWQRINDQGEVVDNVGLTLDGGIQRYGFEQIRRNLIDVVLKRLDKCLEESFGVA